jgi:hypothetical protein
LIAYLMILCSITVGLYWRDCCAHICGLAGKFNVALREYFTQARWCDHRGRANVNSAGPRWAAQPNSEKECW